MKSSIIIIGGASGIGEAVVRACTARGDNVIIADTQTRTGVKLQDELGERAAFHFCDVRVEDSVKTLFYNNPDIKGVVCTAGIMSGQHTAVQSLNTSIFDDVIDVNLRGAFLCAKYATPGIIKTQGVMVLTASIAGVVSPSSSVAYGASKGGMRGLGMTLEHQLAPHGVRVHTICPGNIDTPLKREVIMSEAEQAGITYDKLWASQDLGKSEDVAAVIAWLLTDEAAAVRREVFTR